MYYISEAIFLGIDISIQTANYIKKSNFSCPTTLQCISEAISQSIDKSKQTSESKQIADLIKYPKFSYQTTSLSI